MPAPTTERSPLNQPAAADALLRFLNTHASGPRQLPERLSDAPAMQAWLMEHGLGTESTHVTEADAAGARELRDALIAVLLAHAGDPSTTPEALAQAEEHLRGIAARYPLTTVVTAAGATLTSTQTGIPGLFGTVLANVTELAHAGLWDRLRACRHDPCHFCFFDRTRNSSAGYCGPRCASRASMRAYRRRRKEQAAESSA
ncbi:CGNR zinc finger domain-containing protein [Actinacidiphila glaucinigra]|uniref:CGNR zinc finger domain-containing protein n=1 Tax=Actinacidiphila glaucinigra TaxID=235986 RepID=UPI003818C237